MRRSLMLLVPLVLLLAAPPALGGGFATVGLSSTPAGTAPGQPWNVDITVLQHGRTPLEGVTPSVTIRSGDATKDFAAKPTGEPGVYRASVVFPAAGPLELRGERRVHQRRAAHVPGGRDRRRRFPGRARRRHRRARARADDGGIAAGWLWGAGAALLLALAVLAIGRRRRGSDAVARAPEPAA